MSQRACKLQGAVCALATWRAGARPNAEGGPELRGSEG
ncbi:MAG: hypothetical protein OJF55_000589 [Rhodanobacteraceae bacterium]|nr:MAG: hypothetical protein OJF55_000589 [Rhodanobacteraceae bacterium]